MSTLRVVIKKGEGKTLKFTFKEGGVAKDMTGATFSFVVKVSKDDASYLIEKTDANFDKTDIITGIVRVTLSSTDTAIGPGSCVAEIKARFSVLALDFSQDIIFIVAASVHN